MTLSLLARRLTLPLASLVAMAALVPADALAAGPRPPFQLPMPCGQEWRASTYEQHWNGDQDALDFAQRDESQNNLSDGELAHASAAGTVTHVYTSGGGEHRVFLDHGNGWRSDYVHLKHLPPLTVGQQIGPGEVVGVISNSGASSPHLHYNQMADGSPVRAMFNGDLVDTHAGNQASWNTYGTNAAERLTSVNCAGNAFAMFNQNGLRYQILYKPANGDVKFMRIDGDGMGVTEVWSGNWGRRWTHVVPFTLVGGQLHLLRYKASTGEIRFDRINSSASGTTALSSGTWGAGWTHITPFSVAGKPHLIVYNSLYGYANFEKVNAVGDGTTNLSSGTWTKGWTNFVPYVQGPTQYLMLYKSGSGAAKVSTIAVTNDVPSVTEVWEDAWTPGWTHLVPLSHNGSRRLFAYSAVTGDVSYNQLNNNGQGATALGTSSWTTTWTSVSPLLLSNGDAGLFIYRGALGGSQIRQFNAAGNGSSEIWSGSWTTGWR
jgi:Peptidase family M23